MIDFIDGQLVEKKATHIIIETGGIGYFIHISLHTFEKLTDSGSCRILTHQIIKEDAHVLYGFSGEEERTLFRHLISVSGIGAGTARMLLSSISPHDLIDAIAKGNVALLQSVKGIGSKTAMRAIIDLKDKVRKEEITTFALPGHDSKRKEAVDALLSLGFGKVQVEKVIDENIRRSGKEIPLEELIKLTLKTL